MHTTSVDVGRMLRYVLDCVANRSKGLVTAGAVRVLERRAPKLLDDSSRGVGHRRLMVQS